jgi:hypothetical protein
MKTTVSEYLESAMEVDSQNELFSMFEEFERLPPKWRKAIERGELNSSQKRKAMPIDRAGQLDQHRGANFVIRRGGTLIRPSSPLRSSFNAEKLKYQRHSQCKAYELRMAPRTKATNYEKGAK